MDIDTIISELDNVLHYRGQGGLVEAAPRAPNLLKQNRYRHADDARVSLASDITAAIALLPTDVQEAANGILPIDNPNDYINSRLRKLGIGGYSPIAVRWHRTAVLGRVANELLKFYAETSPSYRILDTDIHVHHTTWSLPALPGGRHVRIVEFRWTIESLISDLRWFDFCFRTPRGLKFIDFSPGSEGYGCDLTVGAPVPNSGDAHFYILRLSDGLPVGVPVKLHAYIRFDKAAKAEPRLDFCPSTPTKRLSLSFTPNQSKTKRTCVELDDTGEKVLRKFKAKTTTKTTEHGEEGFIEYVEEHTVDHFRVRSPRVGRCYRLEWTKEIFV